MVPTGNGTLSTEPAAQRIADGLMRLTQLIHASQTRLAAADSLSALQSGILLRLTHQPKIGIADLAAHFGVTAATISDSVKTLAAKGCVRRHASMLDRRRAEISITPQGRRRLNSQTHWSDDLSAQIARWGEDRQGEVLESVTALIRHYQQRGEIPFDRMCVACSYLAENTDNTPGTTPHFCRFINAPLQRTDLRIDCSDFQSTEPLPFRAPVTA